MSLLLTAAVGCDAPAELASDRGAEQAIDLPVAAAVDASELDEPLACTASTQCEAGQFCATPPGECGREGVCTPVPEVCDRTRAPVCSCDGADYSNPCHAAADQQNVDFTGRCPPPTCTSNTDCDALAYCARATGDCTGTGVCQPRPTLCSGAWNPVCGCNSKTYANACKAAAVGVVVKKLGAC